MTLRRGETLLLTLGIPVVFLLFFSKVSVVSTPGTTPANFFVPGILSLAVMSTAMVSLGIATGFERGYGVLKRLGATPLGAAPAGGQSRHHRRRRAAAGRRAAGRSGWPWAGTQAAAGPPAVGAAIAAILLGSAAFAGIGLLMDGHAARRGQPGRNQRPLPDPAAARRHDRAHHQAAFGGWPPSPSCCRPRRCPPPSTPRSGTGCNPPGSPGRCWRCGRWRPRWPPRSASAGNEGSLVVGERGRRQLRAGTTLAMVPSARNEHGVGVARELELPRGDRAVRVVSTGNATPALLMNAAAFDGESSVSTPTTRTEASGPVPADWRATTAASGGSSVWQAVHQSPKKRRTVGFP